MIETGPDEHLGISPFCTMVKCNVGIASDRYVVGICQVEMKDRQNHRGIPESTGLDVD